MSKQTKYEEKQQILSDRPPREDYSTDSAVTVGDLNKLAATVNHLTDIVAELSQDKAALPIGYVYLQLPGQKSPDALGLTGTWEDISCQYAGRFFRVVKEECEEQKDEEQKVKTLPFSSSTGGYIQADTGRRIYGEFVADDQMAGYNGSGHESKFNDQCLFYGKKAEGTGYDAKSKRWGTRYHIVADSSECWGDKHTTTGEYAEFRPINQSIRVWIRSA